MTTLLSELSSEQQCANVLFYYACRVTNIVKAFTRFCLLLYNCQAKTTEKVSSYDDFVAILYCYKASILTHPIVVDSCGCNLAEDLDRFV